MYTEE